MTDWLSIPKDKLEIIAWLLKFAGSESAAALATLENYADASEETVERQAYNCLNEIDSALASVDGYFSENFGGEAWNKIEERGLDRWEAMAG